MNKEKRIASLLRNNRAFFLAYDQGLEHGPTDFNDRNYDPTFIMNIAKQANCTGVVFQRGTAEHYYDRNSGIPLILKLNGKTCLHKDEPYSPAICTVEEAVRLGASAVGYTIFVGSRMESVMFKEFAAIKKQADDYGLPTIIWAYPRGQDIKNKDSPELIAYAARVALELGADFVKVREPKDLTKLAWAVKVAGKCRVLAAGGGKIASEKFLAKVDVILKQGVTGFAIGRNIWQDDNALELAKNVSARVFLQ
ncbi:MAG: aldolase [archaeon]